MFQDRDGLWQVPTIERQSANSQTCNHQTIRMPSHLGHPHPLCSAGRRGVERPLFGQTIRQKGPRSHNGQVGHAKVLIEEVAGQCHNILPEHCHGARILAQSVIDLAEVHTCRDLEGEILMMCCQCQGTLSSSKGHAMLAHQKAIPRHIGRDAP